MMFLRGLNLCLAALLAIGLFAGAAGADQQKKPRRVIIEDEYYAGPAFIRRVPGLRIFFGDYALSEEEFDELYGRRARRDAEAYDERYYEPELAKPKRKATKKKAEQSNKKKTAAKPAKQAPQKEASAAQKKAAPAKSTGLSCEKASSVVTGYGFSSVTPSNCEGKVYAFNAQRDGKSFAIKLDPASGELTEVKKLP